jgi:signal transduction histidine kinase
MAVMENGQHHKTIRKIGETSRETLENMSDIVWSIQPKNDKLTDVVNRMKKYGQQLFASLGIDFDFVEQDEIRQAPLNMEQRKNLYLIYKEALNNAAKYSGASRITVTISNRSKNVVLIISDNGKGFNAGSQQEGNGLYTMQERARTLNGWLDVQSALGKGTVIMLEFKPT